MIRVFPQYKGAGVELVMWWTRIGGGIDLPAHLGRSTYLNKLIKEASRPAPRLYQADHAQLIGTDLIEDRLVGLAVGD